jgi:uncharacterized protein
VYCKDFLLRCYVCACQKIIKSSYNEKYKPMIGKVAIVLGIVLVASIFINYNLLTSNQILVGQVENLTAQIESLQKQNAQLQSERNSIPITETERYTPIFSGSKSITAVAVRPILVGSGFFQDVRYEGTVMNITVDIREGDGLVLVNTAIPTGVDFQTSAKTAVAVAQEYTRADLSKKDIIFSISSKNNEDLQAVDGPSAGMAMTVLLVLEIQDREIPDTVLMTGTIRQDGSMGQVGGIFEKADAAAKNGADTFIVPRGLGTVYVQECQESREGPFVYRSCKSEPKPLSPIMEEKYGMRVVEASNLSEVLEYF